MGEKRTLQALVLCSLLVIQITAIGATLSSTPSSQYPQQKIDNFVITKTTAYQYTITKASESPTLPTPAIDTSIDTTLLLDQRTPVPTAQPFTVRYVGGSGPGNYSKIQDAVNDSTDGDIIYVYHGAYKENPQINTSITLLGENPQTTIIDGERLGSILHLYANFTSIQGFTFENTSTSIFDDIGIITVNPLHPLRGIQISNCIFQRSGRGVYFFNVSDSSITNCQLQHLTGTSISILGKSNNISICHSLIKYCGTGKGTLAFSGGIFCFGFAYQCTNVTINDNDIARIQADGVLLQNSSKITVLNNSITHCTWWGVCINGQNVSVQHNTISQCQMNGIMTGASSVDISYNNITTCGDENVFDGGILLQDSNKNAVISHNIIGQNKNHGLYLIRSPGTIISYNNFVNNTPNEFMYDTLWSHWTHNYWSDWHGFGPKLIKGWLSKQKIMWYNFDWHPAKEPYTIA